MSFRNVVRQRLLEEMLGCVESEFKVLIVDKYTINILAACCKNSEVVSKQVLVIESLHIVRQPLPDYPALYFLAPKEESVNLLLDDWKGERPYQHAHVFFANRVSDELIDSIGRSKCAKYLRTLKEINVDFYCTESQLFSFNVEHDIVQLLGARSSQEQYAKVAERLAALCTTLNEDPIIRYQNTIAATHVASFTQEKLDVFGRLNPKFKIQCNSNKAILIILDRSIDCTAPLLHEFSYQAMLYDLVDDTLAGTKYTHKFENAGGQAVKKEVTLDDNDPLWTEFRHRHISEVLPELNSSLQSFMQSSKAITSLVKDKKEKDLSKMSQAVRQMPQYQQKVDNFSLHIGISAKLMDLFRQRNLEALALCEQLMATGEKPDGTKCTEKDIKKDMESLLVSPTPSADDKLRLLMLYAITLGNQVDAIQLVKAADLGPSETAAIENLMNLKPPEEKVKKSFFSKTKKKKAVRSAKDTYDVSRYVPALKGVLEAEVDGKLSPADFPYTKEPPATSSGSPLQKEFQPAPGKSLRGKSAPQFSSRGASSSTSPESDISKLQLNGPRLIVFVIGGVTYSEIRSAYEVMREYKREVIVGGTSVLTPRGFLEQMALFKS